MPRKTSGAGRSRVLGVLPFAFSLVAFLSAVLVAVAGTRPKILDNVFFLKVDLSNLDIDPKLGNSKFLQDLSEVSGVDLVGSDATASTLGLAETYTITLLGRCSHDTFSPSIGSATSCTTPRIGYVFDPRTTLHLDSTAISGLDTPEVDDALDKYGKASKFLGIAYIIAGIFTFFAPLLSFASRRVRVLAFAGGVTAWLAAALLLAASVVGHILFTKIRDAMNQDFDPVGVETSTGFLGALSWVGFAFALFAALAISLAPRSSRDRGLEFGAARSLGGGGGGDKAKGMGMDLDMDLGSNDGRAEKARGDVAGRDSSSEPRPGLLGRIQTWRDKRYVHVGKQPMVQEVGGSSVGVAVGGGSTAYESQIGRIENAAGMQEDEERLMAGAAAMGGAYGSSRRSSVSMEPDPLEVTRSRANSDGGQGGAGGAGGAEQPGASGDAAVMSLNQGGRQDMNMAYEPYSSRY